MASMKRWHKAQEFERSWWERRAAGIASGTGTPIDYHDWKASEMEKRLHGFIDDNAKLSSNVLEIGCGPVGIVSALKWGKRYGLDPLEDFYHTNEVLTKQRSPEVHYLKGQAEDIPFPDGFFYLVVADNVLDHVRAAERVLSEIRRVLAPGGFLYFALNIRRTWGSLIHSVLAKLQIDKGHPYSFRLESIRRFLTDHGFAIRSEAVSDYAEARVADRNAPALRKKFKGYAGLSEYIYYAVCSKKVS